MTSASVLRSCMVGLAAVFTACSTSATPEVPADANVAATRPSGQIAIDDESAVPYVGAEGRAAYSVFRHKNLHRAFAISEDGAWAYDDRKEEPDLAIESALSLCEQYTTKSCQIYALDICVVWHDSRCLDALGNFQKGERAYRSGDYITAVAEFWPLAQAGHPAAQLYLAEAYEMDRGIGGNWEAAYQWYLKAAEQGQPQPRTTPGAASHTMIPFLPPLLAPAEYFTAGA